MRIVYGNKIKELMGQDFSEFVGKYPVVYMDLGTGDGRFVYKNALSNPTTLYIGIDPAEKQLEIYSKKSLKGKVDNVLFVVGSFELLPEELYGSSDRLSINLPWGTLLENIVKPTQTGVEKLLKLLKEQGTLEMILGYAPELEPTETKRLNLPQINLGFIKSEIVPSFEKYGFKCEDVTELEKSELKNIETTWAKKLNFGKDRKMFRLLFSK